jgi:hypothetical protein
MGILFDRVYSILEVGVGSYSNNNLHHIRNPGSQRLAQGRRSEGGVVTKQTDANWRV